MSRVTTRDIHESIRILDASFDKNSKRWLGRMGGSKRPLILVESAVENNRGGNIRLASSSDLLGARNHANRVWTE